MYIYIYIYMYTYTHIYIRRYICICISAAVTSRIWLKAYLLAGQPVATRLGWPRGIARSLPKYLVTVSKTLPLPRSRFLAYTEGMRAPNSPSKSHGWFWSSSGCYPEPCEPLIGDPVKRHVFPSPLKEIVNSLGSEIFSA